MTQADTVSLLAQLITISLVQTSISLTPPYLVAAIGEIYAEQSGMLNVGIEGIMVLGAFLGFFGQYVTGSSVAGFAIAGIGGGVLALLMAYLCVTLKLDQIVVGLGVFFVGFGFASYLSALVFPGGVPARIDTLQPIALPVLSGIPILGPILFTQNAMVYLSFLFVPVAHYVLFRTNLGRELRSVGENPAVADSMGVDVYKLRYAALVFGGVLAGVAGAYLTQVVAGRFSRFIVGGRGFIVLGIVIVSLWDPRKALGVVLLLSVLESVQFSLQSVFPDAPLQFALMLPYVATIVILLVIRMYGSIGQDMPGALTVNYRRGGT
ncbi:MAG: ABC transporter permease [Salinigranum sp.]